MADGFRLSFVFGVCCLVAWATVARGSDLDEAFQSPPQEVKPWALIVGANPKLAAADYTRHFDQLKAKGFAGFIGYFGTPPAMAKNPLLPHILKEAERNNLVMCANNTGAWPAGGSWMSWQHHPWATVSSVLDIEGGRRFAGKLPQPPLAGDLESGLAGKLRKFPDGLSAREWIDRNAVVTLAVHAFRLPDSSNSLLPEPVITASAHPELIRAMFDGNWNTCWHDEPPADASKPVSLSWVQFDYGRPRPVEAVWVESPRGGFAIEASDDGKTFKRVHLMSRSGYSPFPKPVTARYFRLAMSGIKFEASATTLNNGVKELAIGTRQEVLRRALMACKSGLCGLNLPTQEEQMRFRGKFTTVCPCHRDDFEFILEPLYGLPTDRILARAEMVDLTGKVGVDGSLDWEAPPGRWRIVWVRRSITNGLEVTMGLPDYLSTEATREDFEKGMDVLGRAAGDKAGKVMQYYHEDNSEIRCLYNWTPGMVEEFQKWRGYDPRPYLAALAGEIVDSVEVTDRFLSDVRRTVADCVTENHYAEWTRLAHAKGMKTRSEAAGLFLPLTLNYDGMANCARVDRMLGEFWVMGEAKQNWHKNNVSPTDWMEKAQNTDVKMVASAAHLYGKPLVDMESFTSLGAYWRDAPSDLLLHANVAMCEGVNQMSFHSSDTTAAAEGSPGSTYVGTLFNDKNTWWPHIDPFVRYVTRCCALLQRGRFVADVLYYIGDEAPALVTPKHIRDSLGFGYDYDACNSELLLTRLSVKDGSLVTPEGLSYRVLVLPDRPFLTLPVARKIKEFVQAGVPVIGPKPTRTPSLSGYPQCDMELKAIADELWDSGKILSGQAEKDVLAKRNTPVDFAFIAGQPDALLDFIHRQDGEAEVYFVINRRNRPERVECGFRVAGKRPELWDAMDGSRRMLAQYECKAGRTTVPLELAAYGSAFVVFREKTGTSEPMAMGKNWREFKPVTELTGPWTVQFDAKWGGPKEPVTFEKLSDWTASPVEGIKHYSGTATYRKSFDLQSQIRDPKSKIHLDLGTVHQLAVVRLNRKNLGVVWCAPWRVEITEALKPGSNDLEIDVVNTWHNRLLFDLSRPKEKRVVDAGSERGCWYLTGKVLPIPAGLLGPVRVMEAE